jgi:purine-binding chemotaxis protein CheW
MSSFESPPSHQQALILLGELRARLAGVERLVAPQPVLLPTVEGELSALVVDVGEMAAALPIASVAGVVPYAWLTPIPEAPAWVAGVLDLGGRMVGVLDVGVRVRGGTHCPRPEDFVVIGRVQERQVGLCVNAVRHVATFPAGAVAPPPADVPFAPYLLGTISHSGSSILLFGVELLWHASAMPPLPEEER